MSELEQLKTMVDTLQRRRVGVKKQIDEFKVLQQEIAGLYARANSDPEAARKLQKLSQVMNTSGNVPQQIAEKVAQVKKSFEQLGKQLKQLAPERSSENKTSTASIKRSAVTRKPRRSFV